MVQARGDWAFYAKVFLFPYWNCQRCCWLCAASHKGSNSYHDCSEGAGWRRDRRSPHQFLEEQHEEGILPSRFFSIPGMQIGHVMIDWLHSVDLGISQDIVGNLFWEVLPKLGGRRQEDNIKLLWQRIQSFYKAFAVPSRLDYLNRRVIKEGKHSPKLRSKAAQCRYLVPLVAQLAFEHLHPEDQHSQTVMHVVLLLQQLYQFLSCDPFPGLAAAQCCRQMCILLSALEMEAVAEGQNVWRMKPKVHIVQEMLEYQTLASSSNPKLCWTYRDEDWGGWVAQCAQSRGGRGSPASVALQVEQRFLAFFGFAPDRFHKTARDVQKRGG